MSFPSKSYEIVKRDGDSLEPIRRSMTVAVPRELSSNGLWETNQNQGNNIVWTTTSLDNPLLSLTPQQYYALKLANEEHVRPPARLRPLISDATFHPYTLSEGVRFRRSSEEYGRHAPNALTAPNVYFGLNTRFTLHRALQGNYRDHSLNL